MLDSNPSQKIKVGWRGTPFTFIAHDSLQLWYSHTRQTPWSVFLDGSDNTMHTSEDFRRAINKSITEAKLKKMLLTQSSPRPVILKCTNVTSHGAFRSPKDLDKS